VTSRRAHEQAARSGRPAPTGASRGDFRRRPRRRPVRRDAGETAATTDGSGA